MLVAPAGAQAASSADGDDDVVLTLANGTSLSDVGAAASLVAASVGDAVVFAESAETLGGAAAAFVTEQQPTRVVLVGGTAALSQDIEEELKRHSAGVAIERLSGEDRTDTAALGARRALSGSGTATVVLANGWSLSDVGTAASAVASGQADAVLYAQTDGLGDATRDVLSQFVPRGIVLIGGTAALSADIASQAQSAAGGTLPERLGGATRVETTALSAMRAFQAGADTAVIANGWSSTDVGIAAALAAALDDAAVLYTERNALGATTAGLLSGNQPMRVFAVNTTNLSDRADQAEIDQILPQARVERVTEATSSRCWAFGTPPPARNDVALGASARFTVVDAGSSHSCGVLYDESVVCWGANHSGQADAPDGTYTAVEAGIAHSCALRTDATVACWGAEGFGITEAHSGTFTSISAGSYHTCAIRTDRSLEFWGADTIANYDFEATAGAFVAVDVGQSHTCAFRTAGTIACWGYNEQQQGDAPEGACTDVVGGRGFSCAIGTDGTIACWGSSDAEIWENGSVTKVPTDAPDGTFSAIAAGGAACALRTDSTIACWYWPQDDSPLVVDVPSGEFASVSTKGGGFSHACGLRTDGTVSCWGYGEPASTNAPTGSFNSIVASTSSSCALRTAGTIACWGANTYGQTDAPTGIFEAVSVGAVTAVPCEPTVPWSAGVLTAPVHQESPATRTRLSLPAEASRAHCAPTARLCAGDRCPCPAASPGSSPMPTTTFGHEPMAPNQLRQAALAAIGIITCRHTLQ